MTAVTTLDRRSDFVSAVAVELSDLAADDRAELIEELDDHIAALLEDRPDVDLVAELGTPRAYAAELRTAAGLAVSAAVTLPWRHRVAEFVAQADRRVPDGVRPWLAGLRPTWWVFRGYVVVAAVCHALGASWSRSGLGVLVPAPAGVWGFGVLVSVLGAAVSVRLGTTRLRRPSQRIGVVALDVVAVLATLVVAGGARYGVDGEVYYDTQYVPNCPIELSNLYAFDTAGKPVGNVRLFDQNGNPFDLSVFGCGSGQYSPAPGAPTNAYPWPTTNYGPADEPTGPPTSLAPLPGATVSAATPGTTAGAGVTPTPTAAATR